MSESKPEELEQIIQQRRIALDIKLLTALLEAGHTDLFWKYFSVLCEKERNSETQILSVADMRHILKLMNFKVALGGALDFKSGKNLFIIMTLILNKSYC